MEDDLVFHVARKKIPYVSPDGHTTKPSKENGIKLEKFVFDTFTIATGLAIFQVSVASQKQPADQS